MDSTYTGGTGLREIPPPPWQPGIPAEFRYPYDILEQALPLLEADGLQFYFTKEAYFLPKYGRNVVAVMLQEERCKVPVYGRQVRAVLRNLYSTPFLGYRPRLGMGKLEAVLTFEYLRDHYTNLRSRRALAAQAGLPAPVRSQPKTIRLPLGYHSQQEVPQIAMADRPLDIFFAGQASYDIPKGSYQHYLSSSKREARMQIWQVLTELQREGQWTMDLGNIAANQTEAGSAYSSYSEKMMQSRICVAPRGSVADSFRAFEGLRAGCLVVANPLPRDEYLFPGAPIVLVDHWREIRGILEKFARNVDALEEWRRRSLTWWHDHLRPEVLAPMVAAGLNEAGASLLP